MSLITIARLYAGSRETIGAISVDGLPVCWSLELPWKMNKKDESCILPGIYRYQHYDSSKFSKKCLKLFNTYNREYISIHPGNTHLDINGCILPGETIADYRGENAVMDSTSALQELIFRTNPIGKIQIVERY